MTGLVESYRINILCLTIVTSTHALNLGLLANDMTKLASPVIINKIVKHGAVIISVKHDARSRKLPKIGTLSASNRQLNVIDDYPLLKSPSRKLPRSIEVPMLPLVPFFMSLLPNLNSMLPVFPSAFNKKYALEEIRQTAIRRRRLGKTLWEMKKRGQLNGIDFLNLKKVLY